MTAVKNNLPKDILDIIISVQPDSIDLISPQGEHILMMASRGKYELEIFE